MKKPKLKRCPFCGGEVAIKLTGDMEYGYFWTITRGVMDIAEHAKNHTKLCQCRIFMESDIMMPDGEEFDENSVEAQAEYDKLVKAWNRRADDGNE